MTPKSSTAYTDPLRGVEAASSLAKQHPAIVATVLYLYVSLIGSLYQWRLFVSFEINIFQFVDTNDLLLAAFKDPFAFAVAVTGVGIGLLFVPLVTTISWMLTSRFGRTDSTLGQYLREAATPQRAQRAYHVTRWAGRSIIIFYTLVVPTEFAEREADRIRGGQGLSVRVSLAPRVDTDTAAFERPLPLVGATTRFVFLYTRNAGGSDSRNHVVVVPTSSIAYMETCERPCVG
jgi:hypothetical protein